MNAERKTQREERDDKTGEGLTPFAVDDEYYRLLPEDEVERLTGLSRTERWRLRGLPDGHPDKFPDPSDAGAGGTRGGTVRGEVIEWLRTRARRRVGRGR